jgi:hypothetical protein
MSTTSRLVLQVRQADLGLWDWRIKDGGGHVVRECRTFYCSRRAAVRHGRKSLAHQKLVEQVDTSWKVVDE